MKVKEGWMAEAEGRGQGDVRGESGRVRFEGARVEWMQGFEGGQLEHRGQGRFVDRPNRK